MSDRSSTDYRHGVPNQVTTMQPDLDAAQGFYGAVFGWTFTPRGPVVDAWLRDRAVATISPLPPMMDGVPSAWVTNVLVDDVDAAAAAAAGAGGGVVAGPFDLPDCRQVVLGDPTGGVVSAWTPTPAAKVAEVVNEPGAWAMSSLVTPDPAAAAPFYGAVFGWTTEAIDFGGAEATMFRLPGYVGGEPTQPVSRETVAVMVGGDEPGWGVGFWVADTEATVAKTVELGGRVLVAPYTSPVGHEAVLADPAGSVFAITQIVIA